jgi:DHA1 family tetracycline resistance protein-like MFS transporter
VGRSLGVFGILFALSQAVLIRPAVKYLGVAPTVMTGLALAVVAFIGVSLVSRELGLWFFLVVGSFSAIAAPALTSLLANSVRSNQQGELQGAINATNALTAIIAPVAATQMFSFFTSDAAPMYFPGAPFFAAGMLVAGSAALFVYGAFRFRLMQTPFESTNEKPVVPPPLPSGQAANRPDTEEVSERDENNGDGSAAPDQK